MRKRLTALALALVLCLGLAIPAWAAGTSALTPAEASAYLKVIGKPQYSGLEDLNGDGKPELIIAKVTEDDNSMAASLDVKVFTIRSSAAVCTMTQSIPAYTGSAMNAVGIARQSGKNRLFVSESNPLMNSESYSFYDSNGKAETYEGKMDLIGTKEVDSLSEELDQVWDMEILFSGEGGSWYAESGNGGSFDVSAALSARAKQTGSTSGTVSSYTVSGYEGEGSRFTITFQVTAVEKKTLMVSDDSAVTVESAPVRATLVSVRPGSTIAVTGGTTSAEDWNGSTELGVWALGGWIDGTNCALTGQIAANIRNGSASKTFPKGNEVYRLDATDQDGDPIFVCLGKADSTVGGFSDVKTGSYCADAVAWAVEKGITNGTTATTFSPNATCTTAQILTFLWRANGSPEMSGTNPFSDVAPGSFCYQAALWAAKKGLVSGSTFNGNAPCTRAATVTYLWKLAGKPAAGSASFSDVPAGASYAQAVAWAVREGITTGTTATTFSPNSTCTRGQIVTFLYRDMA